MHPLLLSLLAHVSAQRRLLINAYACGFVDEADPVAAARELQETFSRSPTLAPPSGNGLDPATSDLVAAMTDEAIADFMERVVAKIEQISHPEAEHAGEAQDPSSEHGNVIERLLAQKRA
jgi:hypothetical protein